MPLTIDNLFFRLETTVVCARAAYKKVHALDDRLAYLQDHLSSLELDGRTEISPFYKSSSFDDEGRVKENALPAGYVFYYKEEGQKPNIIVSYRGTKTKSEKFSDIQISHQGHQFGDREYDVHKGFAKEYGYSKEDLDNVLRMYKERANVMGEMPNVTFTGHSLGGALAQIAALDHATNPSNNLEAEEGREAAPETERVNNELFDASNVSVFTFGAPRVFSRGASQKYDEVGLADKTLHVKHRRDMVPRLNRIGYKEVGHAINITSKGYFLTHSTGATYDKPLREMLSDHQKQLDILEQLGDNVDMSVIGGNVSSRRAAEVAEPTYSIRDEIELENTTYTTTRDVIKLQDAPESLSVLDDGFSSDVKVTPRQLEENNRKFSVKYYEGEAKNIAGKARQIEQEIELAEDKRQEVDSKIVSGRSSKIDEKSSSKNKARALSDKLRLSLSSKSAKVSKKAPIIARKKGGIALDH